MSRCYAGLWEPEQGLDNANLGRLFFGHDYRHITRRHFISKMATAMLTRP